MERSLNRPPADPLPPGILSQGHKAVHEGVTAAADTLGLSGPAPSEGLMAGGIVAELEAQLQPHKERMDPGEARRARIAAAKRRDRKKARDSTYEEFFADESEEDDWLVDPKVPKGEANAKLRLPSGIVIVVPPTEAEQIAKATGARVIFMPEPPRKFSVVSQFSLPHERLRATSTTSDDFTDTVAASTVVSGTGGGGGPGAGLEQRSRTISEYGPDGGEGDGDEGGAADGSTYLAPAETAHGDDEGGKGLVVPPPIAIDEPFDESLPRGPEASETADDSAAEGKGGGKQPDPGDGGGATTPGAGTAPGGETATNELAVVGMLPPPSSDYDSTREFIYTDKDTTATGTDTGTGSAPVQQAGALSGSAASRVGAGVAAATNTGNAGGVAAMAAQHLEPMAVAAAAVVGGSAPAALAGGAAVSAPAAGAATAPPASAAAAGAVSAALSPGSGVRPPPNSVQTASPAVAGLAVGPPQYGPTLLEFGLSAPTPGRPGQPQVTDAMAGIMIESLKGANERLLKQCGIVDSRVNQLKSRVMVVEKERTEWRTLFRQEAMHRFERLELMSKLDELQANADAMARENSALERRMRDAKRRELAAVRQLKEWRKMYTEENVSGVGNLRQAYQEAVEALEEYRELYETEHREYTSLKAVHSKCRPPIVRKAFKMGEAGSDDDHSSSSSDSSDSEGAGPSEADSEDDAAARKAAAKAKILADAARQAEEEAKGAPVSVGVQVALGAVVVRDTKAEEAAVQAAAEAKAALARAEAQTQALQARHAEALASAEKAKEDATAAAAAGAADAEEQVKAALEAAAAAQRQADDAAAKAAEDAEAAALEAKEREAKLLADGDAAAAAAAAVAAKAAGDAAAAAAAKARAEAEADAARATAAREAAAREAASRKAQEDAAEAAAAADAVAARSAAAAAASAAAVAPHDDVRGPTPDVAGMAVEAVDVGDSAGAPPLTTTAGDAGGAGKALPGSAMSADDDEDAGTRRGGDYDVDAMRAADKAAADAKSLRAKEAAEQRRRAQADAEEYARRQANALQRAAQEQEKRDALMRAEREKRLNDRGAFVDRLYPKPAREEGADGDGVDTEFNVTQFRRAYTMGHAEHDLLRRKTGWRDTEHPEGDSLYPGSHLTGPDKRQAIAVRQMQESSVKQWGVGHSELEDGLFETRRIARENARLGHQFRKEGSLHNVIAVNPYESFHVAVRPGSAPPHGTQTKQKKVKRGKKGKGKKGKQGKKGAKGKAGDGSDADSEATDSDDDDESAHDYSDGDADGAGAAPPKAGSRLGVGPAASRAGAGAGVGKKAGAGGGRAAAAAAAKTAAEGEDGDEEVVASEDVDPDDDQAIVHQAVTKGLKETQSDNERDMAKAARLRRQKRQRRAEAAARGEELSESDDGETLSVIMARAAEAKAQWKGPMVKSTKKPTEIDRAPKLTAGQRHGQKSLLAQGADNIASGVPVIGPDHYNRPLAWSMFKNLAPDQAAVMPDERVVKPFSMQKLRWLIAACYQAKLKSDSALATTQRPRVPMHEFVFMFIKNKFGVQRIVDGAMHALVMAVKQFAKTSERVRMFGELVGLVKGKTYTPRKADLFLGMMQQLLPTDAVEQVLTHYKEGHCWVTTDDAVAVAEHVFPASMDASHGLSSALWTDKAALSHDVRAEIIRHITSISEEEPDSEKAVASGCRTRIELDRLLRDCSRVLVQQEKINKAEIESLYEECLRDKTESVKEEKFIQARRQAESEGRTLRRRKKPKKSKKKKNKKGKKGDGGGDDGGSVDGADGGGGGGGYDEFNDDDVDVRGLGLVEFKDLIAYCAPKGVEPPPHLFLVHVFRKFCKGGPVHMQRNRYAGRRRQLFLQAAKFGRKLLSDVTKARADLALMARADEESEDEVLAEAAMAVGWRGIEEQAVRNRLTLIARTPKHLVVEDPPFVEEEETDEEYLDLPAILSIFSTYGFAAPTSHQELVDGDPAGGDAAV